MEIVLNYQSLSYIELYTLGILQDKDFINEGKRNLSFIYFIFDGTSNYDRDPFLAPKLFKVIQCDDSRK